MATKTTAEPKLKALPKTLAACADELYQTRQARLAIEKEAETLKARETQLREHLINTLPKSQASGIAGSVARASIESKTIYQVKDWGLVHEYIRKNAGKNPGVWALLQRRLSDSTVKEMWEGGTKVPGTEPYELKTVSLTKV